MVETVHSRSDYVDPLIECNLLIHISFPEIRHEYFSWESRCWMVLLRVDASDAVDGWTGDLVIAD